MSMITHKPDEPSPNEKAQAQRVAEENAMRDTYARLFTTPDGKRVLAHLEETFNFRQGVFLPNTKDRDGRFDPYSAAVKDGQRQVVVHIHNVLAKQQQPKAPRRTKKL